VKWVEIELIEIEQAIKSAFVLFLQFACLNRNKQIIFTSEWEMWRKKISVKRLITGSYTDVVFLEICAIALVVCLKVTL
jgi:hypothetical protein